MNHWIMILVLLFSSFDALACKGMTDELLNTFEMYLLQRSEGVQKIEIQIQKNITYYYPTESPEFYYRCPAQIKTIPSSKSVSYDEKCYLESYFRSKAEIPHKIAMTCLGQGKRLANRLIFLQPRHLKMSDIYMILPRQPSEADMEEMYYYEEANFDW